MSIWDCLVLTIFLPYVLSGVSISSDGVYSGISVGLHPNLLEGECSSIVGSIENMLVSASDILNAATSGLSIGDVSVIIPDAWESCGTYSVNNAQGYMSWDTSTVRIGEVDPLFGNEPWTQQPRGCGMEGDFISMSSVWMLSTAFSDEDRGSRFVHEWAKYRWGVFEEYGHYGDVTFPDSFRLSSGSWTPNYCTNNELNGGFQSECSDSVDCKFVIQESPDVTSSLMAVPNPELTEVTEFCNSSNHRVDVPTKHNLLCSYSSTWDVIKSHSDIANLSLRMNGHTNKSPREVVITVLRENYANSLVIAYETSETMNDVTNRFSFEKEAIAQFIMYEAPSSSEIGLVSFDLAPIQQFLVTSLEDLDNRQNLAKKVLDTSASKDAASVNLQTAIEYSAQLLTAGNGIILLITKCTDEEIAHTAEELASVADGHPVWVILYPTTDTTNEDVFDGLAALTGGQVIIVEDQLISESSDEYISPNVRLALSQAFRQLLHLNPAFDIQQLDYETCEQSESPCDRELNVPKGFDSQVFLYIYKDSGDKIDNSESSVVVQGGGFCGPLEEFGSYENDVMTTEVMICTTEGESSTIDVSVKGRGYVILVMELVGQPLFEESGFEFELYGTSDLYDLRYTSATAPAIFGKLLYNETRVLFANISAIISFDTTRESVYDDIFLRDDGTGADITGNDGIYSAYLVPAIPLGSFFIAVSADDNGGNARLTRTQFNSDYPYTCCGSVIPFPDYEDLEPTATFSMSKPYITAAISDHPSDLNLPPGSIKDLKSTYEEINSLTITFTATGQDLDYGTADHYVLKTYVSDDEAEEKSVTLPNIPRPSGKTESITIDSVPCETKATILIYAVDGSGLRGGDSNQNIIYIPCIEEDNGLTAGAVAGIVIACIFLIIILIIIVYIVYKQGDNQDEKGRHIKLQSCSCCKSKSDGEYYNSPDILNAREPSQRPPVQKIRTIDDLKLNLDDQGNTSNNFTSSSDSRHSLEEEERNGTFQSNSWHRQEVLNNPNEGFHTDSFQFSPYLKSNDSLSTSNSRAASPFVSQHSINQVGIPLHDSPLNYSDRTTIPVDSRSMDSLTQTNERSPGKTYRHNTQV